MPWRSVNDDDCEFFHEHGYLILRRFIDEDLVRDLQDDLAQTLTSIALAHGLELRGWSFADIVTDGYWRIRESVPEGRSIVYDAVKNLPGLGRMAYHEQLVKVFHALYPHAVVGVSSGGTGIRIDSRDDGAWSSPFHQEFPFHLRSLRGAVYWTPLVPVSHEMGPVRILDGSHKHGLQPLVLEEGPQARSGVNAIRLRDESNIRQLAPEISVESSPGDLILFDYLTVHASGTNHLRRPRWTVQWRVFDFEGPVGRELSWRTSWSAGASARGIVDSVNRLLEGGLDCE